jgi:hypothetical protein
MRLSLPFALLLAAPLAGQAPAPRDSAGHHGSPALLFGVAAGAAKLSDIRAERALSTIVAVQPRPWITFSVSPTLIHATVDSAGASASSSGLGDLPLSLGVERELPGAWSPDFAAALGVTLPTGNTQCGLGSGQTGVGLDVGAGVSPVDPVHLSLGASHGLSGLSSQSSLSAPQATSLSVDASVEVAKAWSVSLSFSGDFGQVDSTQALSRDLGFGASHALGKRLTLVLDGSAGLTRGSPKWAVSLGIGTAYSGVSAVGAEAPFRRLRNTFVGGVGRGQGAGHIGGRGVGGGGGASTSC